MASPVNNLCDAKDCIGLIPALRWDWNEYGHITIDGADAWSQHLRTTNQNDGERMCGFGGSTPESAEANWQYNDKMIEVDVLVPHEAETATVSVFTEQRWKDRGYWGIAGVRMSAVTHATIEAPPSPPGSWSLVVADSFPAQLAGWSGA